MSRIQDYPEATSMADDDILVIDGDAGTRKVKKSKFVEIISEHVDGEIEEMRQDFQDGVDAIYNAIVAEGVTPASSTPQACAAGIHDITQITWTEVIPYAIDRASTSTIEVFTICDCSNVVSIKLDNVTRNVNVNRILGSYYKCSRDSSNNISKKRIGTYVNMTTLTEYTLATSFDFDIFDIAVTQSDSASPAVLHCDVNIKRIANKIR